ncbi:MAG: NADP-dependent isocitrate dehydrogenase [Gammaproteobacteria bacterium]|nr:NADP-dependent isocitrate dehydrogenase [Gammaproteobacteria bacterium]
MSTQPTIIYTQTDEAPALATASLLPIIQYFARAAGVNVETRDISLAGRILAHFPDSLTAQQKQPDALAELGEIVKLPDANVIKLPNISASIPQLQAAIQELQGQGYVIPDYPESPQDDEQAAIQIQYKNVLGSAVNPVLREGNSDRRPIPAAKQYAQNHPHRTAAWAKNSKTHVTHMSGGDFFANEKSLTVDQRFVGNARIEFVAVDGTVTVLKEQIPLQDGEVVDASFMSIASLRAFIKEQMQDAKATGVLFSLHLKATMMKVSDPEIFGHVVEVFLEDVFAKHGVLFEELGVNSNNGIGDIEAKIAGHPQENEIKADIQAALNAGPDMMMVDARNGVTNLHKPNNVIIDASIPPIIRWGGQTTGPDGQEHDVKIIIPDTTYAVFHKEMADFSREHGTFEPATMGSVYNIGLMAQKAEEYGSHDKTFMAPGHGTIRVVAESGESLLEHHVEQGDIWRMCQTKDAPIKNWIELTVNRARITGDPAVFWLDEKRPHDAQLITKVNTHLQTLVTNDVTLHIMAPQDAAHFTNQRVKTGQNTNAATGNVLRDHLTDMYPILELGTSAKMLSIVPLMNGGALLETGAGGSAPKHVEQLIQEGHLRWDSLGEFAAIAESFEHLGRTRSNEQAVILGQTLDQATTKLLSKGKSPSRKTGELDNRGSHFYVALYWAQALAAQNKDSRLRDYFTPLAESLTANETQIVQELSDAQGQNVELGGYFHPDPEKVTTVMRPSQTLNAALG